MRLNHSVANLPGVGPAYQKRLQKLNINTISDLINHFPSRYLDYSQTTPINKLEPDQEVCLKATLVSLSSVRLPNRKTFQKATVTDSTGSLQLTWFNQPYLTSSLVPKQQYYFTGQVDQFRNQLILNSPDFEPVKKEQLHTNRIIPLYPLTAGISHKWLRHKISLVLSSLTIKEIFPSSLKSSLPIDLNSAYHQVHFPDTQKQLELAQKRLSLNDLISIYLKSALTQLDWQQRSATPITTTPSLHNQLLKKLDFDLTPDQQQAINDVFKDLKQTIPMNRLLQGDVGSGKTIVAVSAALQVVKQGFQTLVLAPTQVLAEQHHQSFSQLLKPFSIKPLLVTGQSKKKLPTALLVIGTHALLHRPELIQNQKLGLVVIDEQHRFGVLQRSSFFNSISTPHLLTMSATPIPRTIALSLYGHLKISNINTLPKNRKPIKTKVVSEIKRPQAYQWIKQQVTTRKTQAFFICPLIEDSSSESLKTVKAVTSEYQRLQQIFPDLKIALLHGKMKPEQKNTILKEFKSKKYDILVSTPVIEVGIDIPNANIMVIEGAQRFGLSQLHQLRGRVGRGEHQSFCLLFSSQTSTSSLHRLKLMEKYQRGLTLAKLDLQLRGAGEIFGTAQSGHLDTQFPQFWNADLNKQAKQIAQQLVLLPKPQPQQLLVSLNPNLAKTTSPN